VVRRVNKLVGVRLGLPSTPRAPRVSRRHLRILYARAPRLGIRYLPMTGQWVQGSAVIAEQTALRRLGHVNYARKNWVPEDDDPILNVNTGTDPAVRGGMKHTCHIPGNDPKACKACKGGK
jgi:hypothetical protein